MTFLVTEHCIKCKYQDCVEVCPVDCFYEGENFLVINPEECIDCALCEPECPADAIIEGESDVDGFWLDINSKYAAVWPNISEQGDVPEDADEWDGVEDKLNLLSSDPASAVI